MSTQSVAHEMDWLTVASQLYIQHVNSRKWIYFDKGISQTGQLILLEFKQI
jgi:hypothetical protein